MCDMYKAVLPEETICRVRTILNKMGIKTQERLFDIDDLTCSARITLDYGNLKMFDIGTNGKGLNSKYALASAYGELMERLQNKMMIFGVKYVSKQFRSNNAELLEIPNKDLDFRFFPDEEYRRITGEELNMHIEKWAPKSSVKMLNLSCKELYDMPFLPFYNVIDKEVDCLPYDIIRFAASSTGLCAGNIPEEAILQGLNEIFERYVLQRIYLDDVCLPEIPMSCFKDTEIGHRILEMGKRTQYKFIVKDCSLGEGFPVVGLLVINAKKHAYTFRLGADCSMEIALQRCFTEIFQGCESSDDLFLLPIDFSENWKMTDEYNKNVVNGRGQFPVRILKNKTKASFQSPMWFLGDSFRERLQKRLSWLKERGYTLFVRDNSFLDFPAFHLYIPGLSNVDERLYDLQKDLLPIEDYYKVPFDFRLKRIGYIETVELIEKLKRDSRTSIRMFLYNSSAYNFLNRYMLIALLSYKIGNDKEAYIYWDAFLKQKEKDNRPLSDYYYCIKDLFGLCSLNIANDEKTELLSSVYSKEIVLKVLDDMKERNDVFVNFPIATCFDCLNCKLRQSCFYKDIVQMENVVQQYQVDRLISQYGLSGKLGLEQLN